MTSEFGISWCVVQLPTATTTAVMVAIAASAAVETLQSPTNIWWSSVGYHKQVAPRYAAHRARFL